jgi:hypothetical protein
MRSIPVHHRGRVVGQAGVAEQEHRLISAGSKRSHGSAPAASPSGRGPVTWSIEPSEHGSKVVFRHDGFPDAQPEYDFGSIATTWGQIVTRLKEVVESGGTPNPALS